MQNLTTEELLTLTQLAEAEQTTRSKLVFHAGHKEDPAKLFNERRLVVLGTLLTKFKAEHQRRVDEIKAAEAAKKAAEAVAGPPTPDWFPGTPNTMADAAKAEERVLAAAAGGTP